jgi:hypothetical protein
VQRFRFNGLIFATLEGMAGSHVAAALAALVGLLTAVWLRSKHPDGSSDDWAWSMAVSLGLCPGRISLVIGVRL